MLRGVDRNWSKSPTPNTPSLPTTAFLIDLLSFKSARTTSTPLASSFLAASDSKLRVTARGVNVPSSRSALRTEDPDIRDK